VQCPAEAVLLRWGKATLPTNYALPTVYAAFANGGGGIERSGVEWSAATFGDGRRETPPRKVRRLDRKETAALRAKTSHLQIRCGKGSTDNAEPSSLGIRREWKSLQLCS